ncbi:MAG: hypothetical protein AAGI12_02155 [Pseudomonadota bacterium]
MEFIDSLLLNFVAAESLATARTVFWIIIAVLATLLALYIVRRLTRPRFAGGSRSKKARLAITDAARVDEHGRSVVLLRRDDVEHLLLIGGPNDLVIESNIRKLEPAGASTATTSTAVERTAVPAAAPPAPAAPPTATPAPPPPQPTPKPVEAAPLVPPKEPTAPVLTPSQPTSASVSSAPTLAKPAMSPSVSAEPSSIRPPEPSTSSVGVAKPVTPPSVAPTAAPVRREPPSFTTTSRVDPKPEADKKPSAADEMEALLSEIELPKRT